MIAADLTLCECGAQYRSTGRTIWNGREEVPVCEYCWHQPENIVVAVLSVVAAHAEWAGLEYHRPWDDLHEDLIRFARVWMHAELAVRLPDLLRTVTSEERLWPLLRLRWSEWYVPTANGGVKP